MVSKIAFEVLELVEFSSLMTWTSSCNSISLRKLHHFMSGTCKKLALQVRCPQIQVWASA